MFMGSTLVQAVPFGATQSTLTNQINNNNNNNGGACMQCSTVCVRYKIVLYADSYIATCTKLDIHVLIIYS